MKQNLSGFEVLEEDLMVAHQEHQILPYSYFRPVILLVKVELVVLEHVSKRTFAFVHDV